MGGAIVVALFAALIVPWFVNWDDYRTNFEQEAGRILGHPVSVAGSASASILPSPSLTFTDVRVGPADAPPMMTVERFEVTIELMPLLQGEIRVTAMRLDRPVVRVAVGSEGAVDWFRRPAATEAFDPDKVILAAVSVNDGTVAYADARTGVAMEFSGITAAVEARSLAGPWRADGSYRNGDTAVPFHFATGRLLEDGTIRLKADLSPAEWRVDVSADGVVSRDPIDGLTYAGTYFVGELVENVTGEAVPDGVDSGTTGWRSEGAFRLGGERLLIDKAVLSHGPADRPTTLAGSLAFEFGDTPSFDASAEARQLDLDRALGGGPAEPVEVAAAAERMVEWLTTLPIPDIPGRVALNVPAIVVGGSVIQDVELNAAPAAAGWRIDRFSARLPGQASIAAEGVLATDRTAGFVGTARLTVLQPATFASWWRGGSNQGAGRLLSAFDLSGTTEIAPGRIAVDNIDARIGEATLTGRFAWSEAPRTALRHLGTDLKADSIDFAQLKALAELLVGRDLTDIGVLADSYSVILAAGAFRYDDIRMTDVAVNAEYSDDILKIVRFSLGDLGGASFRVTSGRIDQPTTNPRGELTAELEAENVDGLALLAGRFLPESGLFEWLGRTADVITPAHLSARIVAPPQPGGSGFRIAVANGVAGATTFDVEIESEAALVANWRDAPAHVSLVVASPDSAALARQIGLSATSSQEDSGAHLEIRASGIPSQGLGTTVIADVAGVATNVAGTLVLADDLSPTFSGEFGVSSFDLGSMIASAGLSLPGSAENIAAELEGTVDVSGGRVSVAWNNGRIADRLVGANVVVSRRGDGSWRVDGDTSVDEIDFDWLVALGLGGSFLPTGDPTTPWSKTPFTAPGYGQLGARLEIAADRAALGRGYAVSAARLVLALLPQRVDLDLAQGHFGGGSVAGGVSIHNVDGNASLTSQFTLTGASLDPFVWRLDERAVATGILDVSLNVEAIGRSPAGLVSGMTGGGVVSVHEGEARYIDPTFAARQIVRASDLGQEFTEDALRITVTEQIGADVLRFGEAGGAFTIAGGSVRLRGLSVSAPNKVDAAGNAAVDLNTMTLDSDWTMTFDPGDTKVQGIAPQIGIVFRGPLSNPSRTIDALPFGSYLNTRREARILEIIAQEEADRAEREWFGRVALKLRQDTERAERLAREAAERERFRLEVQGAAAARLDRLHIAREILAEERLTGQRDQWAERVIAGSRAAAAAAGEAAELAIAEREHADALAASLAQLITGEQDAVTAAESAEAEYTVVLSIATDASDHAAATAASAADAAGRLSLAIDRENAALEAGALAERQRPALEAAVASASADAIEAASLAGDAEAEAAAGAAEVAEANRALSSAVAARDLAATALSAAESAQAELESKAQASGANKAAAAGRASEAIADRDRLREQADDRAAAAAAAVAEQSAAGRAFSDLEVALATAEAQLAEAARFAVNARAAAEALAADPAESPDNVAAAEATARALELRQAVRRADVDRLRQEIDLAGAQVASAELSVTEAQSQASMAAAALDAATAIATEATTVAEQAVMSNASLLNMLSEGTSNRDAARLTLATHESGVENASAAFSAAQARAQAAADTAASARAAAAAAEEARVGAAQALAANAEAALTGAAATEAASAERIEAERRAAQVQEEAAAAAEEAGIATAAVAKAADALRTAQEAMEAARIARIEAEAAAAEASVKAVEAEQAAASAAAAVASLAFEAEAAARFLSLEPGVDEAAVPPPPRPRSQPINLIPEALAGDQPLVIVPAR